MLDRLSPLEGLREALRDGKATPLSVAADVLAHADSNASRNTYIRIEPDELLRDAAHLEQSGHIRETRPPLWGVPISLKDCFDLAGARTSCGARFYSERPPAALDSAMAARLRAEGALITGKTHLHPLAYGITGQNADYGDCRQPREAALLTGGSSSGAAASVQEGSALAAIGTDTGGSIRVPAALCGLVGYRASHSPAEADSWAGGAHLAPSFDTLGFLLRDPRDVAPIADALFSIPRRAVSEQAPVHFSGLRIGYVGAAFLADCEAQVLRAFLGWQAYLEEAGSELSEFATEQWQSTTEIFAGIQAHEAAQLHSRHIDQCKPAIRDRLRWGAALGASAVAMLRGRHEAFRDGMSELLKRLDLLLLPCAPVSRLPAAADHTAARQRILRYTTPFSLAGMPVLTLPGELLPGAGPSAHFGTGVQIAAAPGADGLLLDLAGLVGRRLAPA